MACNLHVVHADVVTCMALDKAGLGDHLITGSRDTSCAIWKFGTNVSTVKSQAAQDPVAA